MTKRVYNFSAGPGMLPETVLQQAQTDLLALPGVGMSVLEISHRSKPFVAILEAAEANLRQLMHIPDNYRVLFLQGGATLQFSMLPLNLLRGKNQPADYLVTGSWGGKAVKEAEREGEINLAWSGQADNFVRVPQADELSLSPQAAYVHFTSNETIQGVEFQAEPETNGVPLVCDMSSNILSRPVDVSKYGIIYAGAQKNAGPAGVTMVIIREDLLENGAADLHSMLDYRVQAEKQSAFNTPPVFAIYMVMLVTRWLLHEVGDLAQMATRNREKARLLYEVIDQSSGFYKGHAQTDSRSMMNVTFNLATPELEKQFLQEAETHDLYNLKGHRSVGGIRASIYNAMPIEGVQALQDFMSTFQATHG